MVIVILAIIITLVLLMLWINKVHIDWRSFGAKTLPLDRGIFGVYCYDGKQGSGKTYALTKYLMENADNKVIYSNMTLKNIDYKPILSLKHLLSLRDKRNVYIVYDEILNLLNDKTIPRNIRDELMEFLTQQRKMKNILFTTTQEWLNIPIEFRRFVRIQIICNTKPWGRWGGLLKQEYRDGYQMAWDNLLNEYSAPRIALKFSKYEKRIMESYNTYERVRKLKQA